MSQTTKPVNSGLSYEQYCAQLGVDLEIARTNTNVKVLRDSLVSAEASLQRVFGGK